MSGPNPRTITKSVWGPCLWTTMHAFAYAYPESPTFQERAAAMGFLDSLVHLIPCAECRGHYAENIMKLPPRVQSRDEFARWVVELHNGVNGMLKKKKASWTPEEAEQYWTSGTEGCGCAVKREVQKKTISAALIGVVAGVAGVVIIMLIMSSCRQCRRT